MALGESHRGLIHDRAPPPASGSGREGQPDAEVSLWDEVPVDSDESGENLW